MWFYIGCEENWRGRGDWGKKKKGEKVASLKEISYICSQIAIKIEDYGNDITVKPTTADTIVLELNTSFG
jgi:hypothetical protein